MDSLCSAEGQRLGRTVQFSDAGLYPAQADHTRHLTRDTLGVPVVAAGIPTLMQAQEGADLVVTPRALDSVIAHGAALLAAKRRLDPLQFEAMYQGRPSSREGLLYGLNFAEYDCLPHEIVRRANYTDTADTGDDYLCSLSYAVDADGVIYITDAVYSREPMEATEPTRH